MYVYFSMRLSQLGERPQKYNIQKSRDRKSKYLIVIIVMKLVCPFIITPVIIGKR